MPRQDIANHEKERQRLNKIRNDHVLDIAHDAQEIVREGINSGYCKQDVILLSELIADIGKRFD